jgi:hypothetical protein
MNFISNQNADLLFEVINSTKFMIDREKHNNEINQFSFNKKFMNLNKQELLTMNKEYISYINQLYNSKINNNTPITFEDLQSLKREKFNSELNKKQEEFQELFQKKLPETLNFKEEIDKPISEMEDLISQTIAQRSFDIEQIQKTLPLPPLVENSIQKKQITWEDEREEELSLKSRLSSIETKLDIIIKILTSNPQ